jgi:hypothetical protein
MRLRRAHRSPDHELGRDLQSGVKGFLPAAQTPKGLGLISSGECGAVWIVLQRTLRLSPYLARGRGDQGENVAGGGRWPRGYVRKWRGGTLSGSGWRVIRSRSFLA